MESPTETDLGTHLNHFQVAMQLVHCPKEYTHRLITCLYPSWMPACTHVRTHAHSTHIHVSVCLFPTPVLPRSALSQGCLGRRRLKFPTGTRDPSPVTKGEQCCPSTLTGDMVPLSGTLMGAAKSSLVEMYWLQCAGSVVVAHRLSYHVACGILVPQPGFKLLFSSLGDWFLTTGPTRKFPRSPIF